MIRPQNIEISRLNEITYKEKVFFLWLTDFTSSTNTGKENTVSLHLTHFPGRQVVEETSYLDTRT